jgi:hypothetical protein
MSSGSWRRCREGRHLTASILWRRLDAPGHDACRLQQTDSGWELAGTAAFLDHGEAARLTYEVLGDAEWRTQYSVVEGWIGSRSMLLRIERTPAGLWILNNTLVPRLEGCLDLDLAFTPATNLVQLKRLALPVGESADVPVAWLDPSTGVLERLEQRYERRGAQSYWYQAPRFGYAALLDIDGNGFVRRYPGLWEAEA